MNRTVPRWLLASLGVLAACALIAVGCGDDDDGGSSGSSSDEPSTEQSSGESDQSAEERITAAVEKCRQKAEGLTPPAAASALEAGCTTFGTSVSQALAQGGEAVESAIAQSAEQCSAAVAQLPPGEAQDALTELCDAIATVD